MYTINERLVRGLSRLFGMTRKDFSAFAMGSAQLYAQRMTLWSRLTVADLVKISNATHIPMRHFFVLNEQGYLPNKKEDITYKGEWQEVTINIPFIEYVYSHDDIYSRAGIKKSMGVTAVALYNWFKRKSFNMKAQQACDFCNFFGCDMKNIVNDPNDLIPGIEEESEITTPVEDRDTPPIEKRQRELEALVKKLSNQMDVFSMDLHSAREEAAIANTKLKLLESKRHTTQSYILETEDEYNTPYKWQAQKWEGENVPTLLQLVDFCNARGENIIKYITNSNDNKNVSPVIISEERLTTLLHLANKNTTSHNILASQFCSLLNECILTPACVLDAAYLKPTFPDKLLRMIAER